MMIKSQKGQTLLEVIFVLSLVIIALLAIMALIMSNIAGTSTSKLRIVASNLAREGVEVARGIRDNNWLSYSEWNHGLSDGSNDYTAIASFDETRNEWQLDFVPDDLTDDDTILYFYAQNGLYRQEVGYSLEGVASIYRRLITLDPICSDGSIKESGAGCEDVPSVSQVGVRVRSEVFWVDHGRDYSIMVEDWLYNWR